MLEFTYDDAMTLISKMRVRLGKKFSDQWAGVTPRELANAMVEDYQGLTPQDIERGVNRLKTAIFAPTVSEFLSWCKPKADAWLDAHEAWATAKQSVEFGTGREMTVVWTEQSAKAFEKCSDLVVAGDKYQVAEAKKIFVSIYERLVTEAKDQGLKPVYNVSLGVDPDQRIQAIRQAEISGFLTAPETQLQLEHKQTKAELKAEADQFKTTAQKALANLKDKLKIKPTQKDVNEAKDIQVWELKPDSDYWPDPFDQNSDYVAMHKAEGKAVPRAAQGGAA